MQLQERMSMTVIGQVTWANPEMNAKCSECDHYQIDPIKRDRGVCALVKAFTKKKGKLYKGENAVACSKFLG